MKHPEVEKLRSLDALDAKIAKLRRELKEIPEELAKHKDQEKALAARLEKVHEDQKKLHKEIDKLELDIRGNNDQSKKYLVQQNTAKTNEEYSTLKKQIEALKKANSDLEDKQLAIYEKMDVLKAEETKAREALKGGNQKLKDEEAAVGVEVAGVQKELDARLAERAAFEQKIDMGVYATYKRIMDKTGNRALAPVHGRTCQGCYMEIPSNNISMLLGGKDIVLCKSCSRILYLEDNYRAVTSTSYSVSDKERDATSKDGNW